MSLVTLPDGRQVDSSSEEWRHTCEAVAITKLPSTGMRRAWLEDLERRRGKEAADRLRDTIKALWAQRQP